MRMVDLIAKKRDGQELTGKEIEWLVQGYTQGTIPDYQMSAWMMAVYLKGMTAQETAFLTAAMVKSGEELDLSAISGVKVDKHSTGGVGDKTTLIVGPIAAACGLCVAKMSGRGLGHTGGTLDKLESIPGLCVTMTQEQFLRQVNEIGLAVMGQSEHIAPADKKMYALRDVTATVSCIPLIASSIMSKKLAAGADCILLDVKVGSGAFMKTQHEAEQLARCMVEIGRAHGKQTAALMTNMDVPLGACIGNSLEVEEAVDTLLGKGPADLTHECLMLSARLLMLAEKGSLTECLQQAKSALESGKAFEKFLQMIRAQGGSTAHIEQGEPFLKAAHCIDVRSPKTGYLTHMDAEKIGLAAMLLGAGRETKESVIDHAAGIRLLKKTGQYAEKGEVLAKFYLNDISKQETAQETYLQALCFTDHPPVLPPSILGYVNPQGEIELPE